MALQNVQWLGSNIKEDDNHRLVTNNQIETWDNKADKEWIELTPSNWKEYMEESTSDNVVINNILIPCAVDNPFYVFPVYGADQKFVINLGMQAYLMDNLGAIVNFSVLKIDKSYNEFLSNFFTYMGIIYKSDEMFIANDCYIGDSPLVYTTDDYFATILYDTDTYHDMGNESSEHSIYIDKITIEVYRKIIKNAPYVSVILTFFSSLNTKVLTTNNYTISNKATYMAMQTQFLDNGEEYKMIFTDNSKPNSNIDYKKLNKSLTFYLKNNMRVFDNTEDVDIDLSTYFSTTYIETRIDDLDNYKYPTSAGKVFIKVLDSNGDIDTALSYFCDIDVCDDTENSTYVIMQKLTRLDGLETMTRTGIYKNNAASWTDWKKITYSVSSSSTSE